MKKLISLALTLAILMQFSSVCFAAEIPDASTDASVSSYLDTDGSEICVVSSNGETEWTMKRLPNGYIVTQDYIDGSVVRYSTFTKINDNQILYTSIENGISTSRVVNISDYISISSEESIVPYASRIFRGTIFYNPKVYNGVSYERTLGIWYQIDSTTRDGYTIRGNVGETISFIASIVAAALTVDMNFITAFLISALADYLVNNVVEVRFTETVNAINVQYTIISVDNATNVEIYHYGSSHHVDIPGRRNEFYLEGDLPFGDSSVAYRMFNAHWPNDWTGINYFYPAYESEI